MQLPIGGTVTPNSAMRAPETERPSLDAAQRPMANSVFTKTPHGRSYLGQSALHDNQSLTARNMTE